MLSREHLSEEARRELTPFEADRETSWESTRRASRPKIGPTLGRSMMKGPASGRWTPPSHGGGTGSNPVWAFSGRLDRAEIRMVQWVSVPGVPGMTVRCSPGATSTERAGSPGYELRRNTNGSLSR